MKDICGLAPIWISKDIDGVEFYSGFLGNVHRHKIRCLPEPPVSLPEKVVRSLNVAPNYYGDDPKFALKDIPPDANSIFVFQVGDKHYGLYARTKFEENDSLSGIETRTLHGQ